MKKEIIYRLTESFEDFLHQTKDGVEFWFARDLQHLLGYEKWDNFQNVISKAKTACEVSGQNISDHFAEVGKMVEIGSGAKKEVEDFMPTILLKAKDFATEITIFNAKQNKMRTESQISKEHITNNKTVRNTLLSRGIVPENLPPEEDVKKIERKLKSEELKSLKNNKGFNNKSED